MGITKTFPDVFNIVAGNATANATGYAGTFSVWEAEFSSLGSSVPAVRKIANIPEAMFLNGIVPVPGRPDIVLIPDSQFGLLFRLDTSTQLTVAGDTAAAFGRTNQTRMFYTSVQLEG